MRKVKDPWRRITIGQVMQLDALAKVPDLQPDIRTVKILAIVTNLSEDVLMNTGKDQLKRLMQKYRFLDTFPTDGRAKEFDCGGYTWIPALDITQISPRSQAQLSMYIEDQENIVQHLPALLALVCTPVKRYPLFIKRTPILTPDQRAEILKQARVSDVFPLSMYYCRLLVHMANQSHAEIKQELTKIINEKHSN